MEKIIKLSVEDDNVIVSDDILSSLKQLFSGCRVNFLLGAGFSAKLLGLLNNNELIFEAVNKFQSTNEDERSKATILTAFLYWSFYKRCIAPISKKVCAYSTDFKPYLDLGAVLYRVFSERGNPALDRQFNVFTTNYDPIVELMFDRSNCVCNDGFEGRIAPRFSTDNYSKSYYRQAKLFVSPMLDSVFTDTNRKPIDEYLIFEFALRFKFLESLCSQFVNEEHIAPLLSRFDNRSKRVKHLFRICDNPPLDWLAIYSLVDVNVEFKKIVPLIICKYFYEKQRQDFQGHSLHIIIDEAHNVLSTASERESQTWKDYRLETFEEIIKEGRKFGTFLTISSQRPSDISETIISQLHNYFIHRLVNNEDIRAIGKAVAFIDNTSYEMISVLPQGACIFTGVASNFPVLVQVDLLPKNKQPQSTTVDLFQMWN